jgi:hypothetical protein
MKIEVEITAAIVDRPTFGANIIETGSDSYCAAHARKNQPAVIAS